MLHSLSFIILGSFFPSMCLIYNIRNLVLCLLELLCSAVSFSSKHVLVHNIFKIRTKEINVLRFVLKNIHLTFNNNNNLMYP